MFEKFRFSRKQIEKYHKSAIRDLKIAAEADVPEVCFRFCYDALLKLAFFLQDSEIEILADEMRSKRNRDLYGGGIVISQKEAKEYLDWTKRVFLKAESFMHRRQARFSLR